MKYIKIIKNMRIANTCSLNYTVHFTIIMYIIVIFEVKIHISFILYNFIFHFFILYNFILLRRRRKI